jgi:superfamily I DNA/RNA helicase
MNPFDRARIQAINARAKLIAACGEQYTTSQQLIDVAEATLGIAIEWVSPDDYALGGADALLQRSMRTILIRDDVRQEAKAYLLAHELGHWYLDSPQPAPGTSTVSFIADPDDEADTTTATSNPSSTSPGSAVVEGYGAWERNELQANVFARELLLPRTAARALWSAGWRSRLIATHFLLPLEVVRQQLADALLLPDVPPVPPAPAHPPSDAQRLAAEAPEKFVNVVAGPGTGKTTTLVHRVAHLIASGVPANRILVMTFTNRAAQELAERLTAANVPNASQVWAGTFHSFGLELLRKHHLLFGLTPQIKIADALQQVRMMVEELPTLQLEYFFRLSNPYDWLPDVLRIIHRLKEELVTPDEYAAIVRALPAVEPDVERERNDIVTLYRAYEAVLRREGWVDYADLLVRPTVQARDDRSSLAAFLEQYDHVLVDEYQDVNHVMIEFVKKIGSPQRYLWVVGDIRQAIHHWRGASIQSLLKFDEAYVARGQAASIRRYSLDINRRSSPEILRLVERAGTYHVLQPFVPLDPVSPSRSVSGVMPALFHTQRDAQSSVIVGEITQCRAAGHSYGSQGIISSTNAQVDKLAQDIEAAGIPVLHLGELNQRAEVKEFMCLMQLLTQRSPGALLGLFGRANLRMPAADIETLTNQSKLGFNHQRGRWLSRPTAGLSAQGQQVVQELSDLLEGATRSSRPWVFVCDLLFEKGFGLESLADQSAAAQINRLALWQFLYGVRNSDGVGSQATLSKFLVREDFRRYIGQRSAERALPPEAAAIDAVRLMTVHGSKGLEFDVVHMANVEKSKFGAEAPPRFDERQALLLPPEALHSTQALRLQGEAIERNNLLYVGLSRAKDRLKVYGGTDAATIPDPLCDPSAIPASVARASVPVAAPVSRVSMTPPVAMTYAALDGFMTCSLQYHYAHELGLPIEQELDVSIRARRAVLAGLEYVYRDGMKTDDAFLQAWGEKPLPTWEEDKMLIEHAWIAFNRGAAWQPGSASYVPETTASVNGQAITMPWMLRDASGDVIWLRTGVGLSTVARNVRPILENLGGRRCNQMSIHSLVTGLSEDAVPSARASSTSVFKAIAALRAGERKASRGKQCNRCAYATICAQRH